MTGKENAKPIAHCDSWCEDCGHRRKLLGEWTCEYWNDTGHLRPCPAGTGCTEHTKKKAKDGRPNDEPAKTEAVRHRATPAEPMDELRAMELWNEGLDDLGMAETLGVTVERVKKWRSRMHLTRVRQPKPGRRKMDREEARELFHAGATDQEIAARYGVKPDYVAAWRRSEGLLRKMTPKGKVQDDARALELFRAGMDDRAMAEKLGVSQRSVKNWRLRQGFKRATGAAAHKKAPTLNRETDPETGQKQQEENAEMKNEPVKTEAAETGIALDFARALQESPAVPPEELRARPSGGFRMGARPEKNGKTEETEGADLLTVQDFLTLCARFVPAMALGGRLLLNGSAVCDIKSVMLRNEGGVLTVGIETC